MMLSEAIKIFLGEYQPATATSYNYVLSDMVSYLGPARPLDSLAPIDLTRYAQHYKNRVNERTGKPLAAATQKKYATTVKLFFRWCVSMRLIDASPADAIKRPKVERRISRDKALTDAELNTMINWVNGTRYGISPVRNLAIILFLADTGCRAGGLCGLTLSDINPLELFGRVTEKGNKTRPVTYGRACADAIVEWLTLRPDADHDYIFTTLTGKKLNRHTLGQIIRRISQASGLTRTISPHAFRHRKGHQFADHRIAPSIAATALGHESSSITLEYYYPSDWDTAAEMLQELSVKSDADEQPTAPIMRPTFKTS